MKKRKRLLKGIMLLLVISCMLPITVKAVGTGQPTRIGKLELGETAEKNESEGWDWRPDADGGGTLTLTDCYIQSDELLTLYFNNITQKHTVTIVLKGENIIETTSQKYGGMINSNYDNNGSADIVIREEGTGSLEVRTSTPITTGSSPHGFTVRNFTIESGSVYSNVEICLLTDEFLMQGGLLKVCTPERIDDVFGIVSVKGPINIEGGTVDITAGHIGIITNGENGAGWSVNISGGDVRIKARQSCIQMQNRRGLPESRVINITGGTFTGESDITGLYADNINIVKEGVHAPVVTINAPGDASNPNIKALHAIKELAISDSIVAADTIYNYDASSTENSIVFQGKSGQVYGNVTLDADSEIPEGCILTIPEDSTLTIPGDVRFNIPESAAFVNNGMLVLPENGENISCTGTGLIKKGDELYNSDFARLYSVIVETADGEITNYYKEGDLVELKPETAPKGMVFKEWKVTPDTVVITDNQFAMPAGAVTVIPIYEDISYEIEVSANPEEGGTVTGNGKVKEGDFVTVTAQANSGYVFTGWTEEGQEVSTDAEYTFTVSADRILTACFEKIPEVIFHEIEVSANPKEGGTVTGGGKVNEGDSVTVTAQVNSGYVFTGWTEEGQEVSTDAEYTFTVSADRTLTACFKKKIPENAPGKMIQVENTVRMVADVKLPAGWSFDGDSAKKTIPAGKSVTATAVYAAEDAKDYYTTSIDIDIKRAACEEAATVIYTGTGEQAPNCTTDGIGHTECKLCGDIVGKAVKVPAAGHIAGETVVTKAATDKDGSITSYCTVCNTLISETAINSVGNVYLNRTTGVYSGKIHNPSAAVKDSKGNELKQGADYIVIYPKDMKNVGIYSVKVTFLGNYEGTVDLDYTITPKGTSISKLKAKKKGFSVKWKKQISQTTGYEIQYSTSKKFTKKTTKSVTVKKNKTTSKSVSKKKANKKYYVRIRTYKTVRVNGKNIKLTSGWSKAKTVKTRK